MFGWILIGLVGAHSTRISTQTSRGQRADQGVGGGKQMSDGILNLFHLAEDSEDNPQAVIDLINQHFWELVF